MNKSSIDSMEQFNEMCNFKLFTLPSGLYSSRIRFSPYFIIGGSNDTNKTDDFIPRPKHVSGFGSVIQTILNSKSRSKSRSSDSNSNSDSESDSDSDSNSDSDSDSDKKNISKLKSKSKMNKHLKDVDMSEISKKQVFINRTLDEELDMLYKNGITDPYSIPSDEIMNKTDAIRGGSIKTSCTNLNKQIHSRYISCKEFCNHALCNIYVGD